MGLGFVERGRRFGGVILCDFLEGERKSVVVHFATMEGDPRVLALFLPSC